ncbi:MAG: ABC transporter permease [Dehalococcoidia bacterium]|nr:ABC transporter permease [Dehalococcoidia bacterium]
MNVPARTEARDGVHEGQRACNRGQQGLLVDSERRRGRAAPEERSSRLSTATSNPAAAAAEIGSTQRSRGGLAWTIDLLFLLTWRDLKVRYQGTILGFFWSVTKPLLLGLVLYFALSEVVRFDVPNYQLFLLAALFPWFWFQTCVMSAIGSFTGNGNLLKKVSFPRYVLPLSMIANHSVHFALSLPVLAAFSLIFADAPGWAWIIGIPLLSLIQVVLISGLSLLVATINVFFRDLEHLTEVAMTLLFYVTPIIYPLDLVPDRYQWILLINPMTCLIEGWRDVLVDNRLPGLELWPAVALSAVLLAAGAFMYRRLERHFADVL